MSGILRQLQSDTCISVIYTHFVLKMSLIKQYLAHCCLLDSTNIWLSSENQTHSAFSIISEYVFGRSFKISYSILLLVYWRQYRVWTTSLDISSSFSGPHPRNIKCSGSACWSCHIHAITPSLNWYVCIIGCCYLKMEVHFTKSFGCLCGGWPGKLVLWIINNAIQCRLLEICFQLWRWKQSGQKARGQIPLAWTSLIPQCI